MNDNAKLWVKTLRSDEFEQGMRHLHSRGYAERGYEDNESVLDNAEDKFCCLGLACVLAIRAGVPVEVNDMIYDDEGHEIPADDVFYDGESEFLPPVVQRWLGLATNVGEIDRDPRKFEDEDLPPSLAEANDGGASFAEIADLIESEPAGLFR